MYLENGAFAQSRVFDLFRNSFNKINNTRALMLDPLFL